MTAHVEDLLPDVIKAAFPDARVCTETPENLANVLPCIQVVGIGGSGDRYDFDRPRVDIDVYEKTRGLALALSMAVHSWALKTLSGMDIGDTSVLSVTEFLSPIWTPHENTNLRRFTFSVGLNLHTRSTA